MDSGNWKKREFFIRWPVTSGSLNLAEKVMNHRLANKIAVITGGTSGIGFATAKRFVAEGAFVFFTGRRAEAIAEAQKALGSNAVGVRGDVAKLADLDHLYDTVGATKG